MAINISYNCTIGGDYYHAKYKVFCDHRLKYKPYAQCGYEVYNVYDKYGNCHEYNRLHSYCTNVALIIDNRYAIVYDWYSTTTTQHVSAFFREFIPHNYQPNIYKKGQFNVLIDTLTGEIVDSTVLNNIDISKRDPNCRKL